MCIWSDITAVQDCEMHYMNAWLKRCVFNLDLNRESVSKPWTLSGRLLQSLGAKYEKVLPPLASFSSSLSDALSGCYYMKNKTTWSRVCLLPSLCFEMFFLTGNDCHVDIIICLSEVKQMAGLLNSVIMCKVIWRKVYWPIWIWPISTWYVCTCWWFLHWHGAVWWVFLRREYIT